MVQNNSKKSISQKFLFTLLTTTILSTNITFSAQAEDEPLNYDAEKIDTIIVTARRQNENAQEIPVAVTVKPGSEMGSGMIDDLKSLANAIPGTMFYNNGGPSVSVRGLGYKGIVGLNQEVSTGIFVDDIYIGRSWGVPSFLDDLERAEVVRGSQSTLYGKNTIGGAINLISQKPGEELGGEISGSFGDNGHRRLRAALDLPIVEDKLQSRAYFSYSKRDGFVDNLTTGKKDNNQDSLGGRLSFLGQLSDNTAANLTMDIERLDDDGQTPFAPVNLAFQNQNVMDLPSKGNLTRGGIALRIDHDFNDFSLTSNTGYRAYNWDLLLDGDFSETPYLLQGQEEEQSQISQEIRLFSNADEEKEAGDFEWSLGLFFLHEKFDGKQFYDLVTVPVDQASSNQINGTSDTYSIFGTIYYNVTNAVQFNLGGRYTREEKQANVTVSNLSGSGFFGAPLAIDRKKAYENFSPEIGLNYRLSDNAIAYGKVNRGFKAGGISEFIELDGSLNEYDPELAWTYEIGSKLTLMNENLHLNFAAYHTDLKNQQVIIFVSPFQRVVRNASTSTLKGFEIEATLQASKNLQLLANYGYVDAQFDNFVDPLINADYSNNPLPYAPKHSVSLGIQWVHDISDEVSLLFSTNYNYRSTHTFDPAGNFLQKAQHLVHGRIGVNYNNWTASLWVENLMDNGYLDGYFLFNGTTYGKSTRGRVIGFELKKQW